MEEETLSFDDNLAAAAADMAEKRDKLQADGPKDDFTDTKVLAEGRFWRTDDMDERFLTMQESLEVKLQSMQASFEERFCKLNATIDEKLNHMQAVVKGSDEKAEQKLQALEEKMEAAVEETAQRCKAWGGTGVGTVAGAGMGAGDAAERTNTSEGGTEARDDAQSRDSAPSSRPSTVSTGAVRRSSASKAAPAPIKNIVGKRAQPAAGDAAATSEGEVSLEHRVEALEAAVRKALQTLFPRVESLLKQFETKDECKDSEEGDEASEEAMAGDDATSNVRSSAAASTPATSSTAASATAAAVAACSTPTFPKSPSGSKNEAQRRLNHGFIQAAKRGCVHEMRFHHEQGADINARDHQGKSALHHAVGAEAVAGAAARARGAEAVSYLLTWGADVGVRAQHGWTPLHDAARAGHVPHVEALVRWGADMELEDDYGYTALHWAAFKGRVEVASMLLRMSLPPGGATAAVAAVDKRGRTPLYYAAQQGHTQLVQTLAGPPGGGGRLCLDCRDSEGATALHAAAAGGQEAAVKALITAGATINVKDKMYRTPFDVAKTDAIKKLLKPGIGI